MILIVNCGIALMLAIITLMLICYTAIDSYTKYTVQPDQAPHYQTGLVLGAGIAKNGQPYNELKARLDVAAEALKQGIVQKLILSGDNRFDNYDEPTAMYNYLIDKKGVEPEKLVRDYAGRSTYESCERAAKIFQVKQLIIFSASSHLPRANYLCRSFGIESYGISSNLEAGNSLRREMLARVKALYNTHVLGEPTILGTPMPL